jgi:hypothetical protein
MHSIKILLIATAAIATMSIVQARQLLMAPLKGRADTFGKWASITVQGQVAQGLFEKMPESSIVIENPDNTCILGAVTKIKGGIECVQTEKKYYECKMAVNLATGLLIDRNEANADGSCGLDQSELDKIQKDAKKKGYWTDVPDDE